MLLLALLLHAAFADPFDIPESALQQLGASVRGKVEAQTGRRLRAEPAYHLRESPVASSSDAAQELGAYEAQTNEIVLHGDRIRRIAAKSLLDPQLIRPVYQCVIAHELVHAIQFQTVGNLQDTPMTRALLEGHAELVTRRVCDDGWTGVAQDWLEATKPIDSLASRSREEEITFSYGFSRAWIAAVQREGGNEAVWKAFRSPPDRESLLQKVEPLLVRGWSDTGLLRPVFDRLERGSVWNETFEPCSTLSLLSRATQGRIAVDGVPRSAAGLCGRAARGEHARITLGAWRLERPAAAQTWLDARRSFYQASQRREIGMTPTWIMSDISWDIGLLMVRPFRPRIKGRDGFQLVLEDGDGAYGEQWLAVGDRLYCIISSHVVVSGGQARRALKNLHRALVAGEAGGPDGSVLAELLAPSVPLEPR